MMNNDTNNLKGLRIITNLSCQYNCKFCYQKNKSDKKLSIHNLIKELIPYVQNKKVFDYCTIMGGESTLLENLPLYIAAGAVVSKETRLTTNGKLLTEDKLKCFKSVGLTGVNISVATLDKYEETTRGGVTKEEILGKIEMTQKVFPNMRINIALCKENIDGEIRRLINRFLSMGINITICEDIHETFSIIETSELMDADLVEDTGLGLVFFKHRLTGKKFGYYHHADNYKNTDLIVSPLGVFVDWDKFCESVGYNNVEN